MNEREALELIAYCGEKWGAAAAVPAEKDRLALRVRVWLDALSDLPAQEVRAVLAAAEDEFPPNVTVIRRRVERGQGALPEMPGWDEFWGWVRAEASRSMIYTLDSAPEFVCPWPMLAGIVTVETVAQWARDGLEAHEFESVLQAHLRRHYEARVQRVTSEAVSDVPAMSALRSGSPGQIGIGTLKRVDET